MATTNVLQQLEELRKENEALRKENEALRAELQARYDNRMAKDPIIPVSAFRANAKFFLVDAQYIIGHQTWLSLADLKRPQTVKNGGEAYYWLLGQPLKVMPTGDGRFILIDGNHRFFRGLLAKHRFFLVELAIGNPAMRPASYIEIRLSRTDLISVGQFENPWGERLDAFAHFLRNKLT
ncbi:hypothetical protein M427DRAFT_50135 [Gonapodya prolifera JEL478]|uniref:ParB/Sulfiredoxin domain-containing protein n=1 Tax=Gonapodya prolifera (strain JEL478) TaxID=1344416 RepID=A0A138ZWT6_GONPJ|nr:hypothetical protein M427DRAFT_50135 [Gonapodya prolifera JEL478]|eukprot:KXS08970.1 hypothetical protein M427DRAFT_50135 [Gonapodya prolifera JEL478]